MLSFVTNSASASLSSILKNLFCEVSHALLILLGKWLLNASAEILRLRSAVSTAGIPTAAANFRMAAAAAARGSVPPCPVLP
jgi:uncharacterized membrane protein YccF (DUF307 family)